MQLKLICLEMIISVELLLYIKPHPNPNPRTPYTSNSIKFKFLVDYTAKQEERL